MWVRKHNSPNAPRYKTARCVLHREGRYLLAVHSSFWGVRQPRWGLPGGQIERGESPAEAVRRELREELSLKDLSLMEVGAYAYKQAQHMVFAAHIQADIRKYDTFELLDVQWFTAGEVADLHRAEQLHANYELQAIRALRDLLVQP